MQTITVKEILEYLETGAACSMRVIAYDRKRKRGGHIKDIDEAKLLQAKTRVKNARGATKMEQLKKSTKRSARHRKNFTRNLVILQDGFETSLIEKIHPPLIIQFNGKKVLV